MKTQTEWNKDAIKLFNLGYKSEVVTDERSPIREMEESVPDIGRDLDLYENHEAETRTVPAHEFIREVQKAPVEVPVVEEPIIPEPTPEPQPVVIKVDPKIARMLKERGVEYFCAPCVGHRTFNDDLYGESYTRPRFGDQFMFDAILVDQSDLQLQFWCIRAVTKDSIIYRKDPQGGERWWQVGEVEPKSGGYLVLCHTSELNPDFS